MNQLNTEVDNRHRSEKVKPASFRAIIRLRLWGLAMLVAVPCTLSAQEGPQAGAEDKRILWIFTNHRTTDDAADLPELTRKGKFAIAWGDATDRAIFAQRSEEHHV